METAIQRVCLLQIVLPFELTNGNDGRGSRWFSSAKVRKKIEKDLRLMGLVRKPFEVRVVNHVTRLYGKGQREWDSSSIGRGNWKEIEDAMVVCGWFHDDSTKYIKETRFFQKRGHGKPEILVEVFAVDDPSLFASSTTPTDAGESFTK